MPEGFALTFTISLGLIKNLHGEFNILCKKTLHKLKKKV